MKNFIFNIRSEFGKLKIPNRKEVLSSAVILLVCVLVSSIVFSILDYLVSFISVFFK